MTNTNAIAPLRPEFVRQVMTQTLGVVEKPLNFWEKLYNIGAI